jgi:sepiapterin reductase
LSYAPGPLDNEMQQHVRETLADPEQNKLYSKMANEVNIVYLICWGV